MVEVEILAHPYSLDPAFEVEFGAFLPVVLLEVSPGQEVEIHMVFQKSSKSYTPVKCFQIDLVNSDVVEEPLNCTYLSDLER